jgi:hypothetical protein
VSRATHAVVQLIEAIEAQVVRAALHARRSERDAERLAQSRNVLEENLFPEDLGPVEISTLAAQDGWNEIRKCLFRCRCLLRPTGRRLH